MRIQLFAAAAMLSLAVAAPAFADGSSAASNAAPEPGVTHAPATGSVGGTTAPPVLATPAQGAAGAPATGSVGGSTTPAAPGATVAPAPGPLGGGTTQQ